MALESLSHDELRALVLKHEDLKHIPVCGSTRSLLIRKLTERDGRCVVSSGDDVKPESSTTGSASDREASAQDQVKPAALPDIKPARQIKLNSTQASVSQSQEGKAANDYPSPTTPELSSFRLLVERNDIEGFKKAVLEGNPRMLATSSDAPEILKRGVRYNALHCAAIKGCLAICKLLFQILQGDLFWSKLYPRDSESVSRRRRHLIDLYLNTCEEGNRETPLHLACKYGHEEMVEYLLGFSSMLDVSVTNKYGESASEITRNSCKTTSEAKKKRICDLLSEPHMYYVRVLRAPDNSLCPKLDKPCLYDELKPRASGNDSRPSPYTAADTRVVSSFAGPMSPIQAKSLYSEWRSPSFPADQNVKRADPDRGLEIVGRKLAHQQGLPWSEHWEFLNCSCDLASHEGRRVLEDYLRSTTATSAAKWRSQSGCGLSSSPTLSSDGKGGRDMEVDEDEEEGHAEVASEEQQLAAMLEEKLSLQTTATECVECVTPPRIATGQAIVRSFLTGSKPTKLDYDVLLALNENPDPIDSDAFPYISKWLDLIHTYSEREQKRWQTPIRVLEKNGGVALWRSPQKSQGSSVQRLFNSVSHSSHQNTPTPHRQIPVTSNLVYSSSPSSSASQRVVKQTPRELFPTFSLDLDNS